jgi:hypothetical protein
VTLREGSNSIFDADGSTLVIHGAADDHRTDPTGNSGPRIACGVITKSSAPGRATQGGGSQGARPSSY